MNFFNTGLIFTPEYFPCKKLSGMRGLEAEIVNLMYLFMIDIVTYEKNISLFRYANNL